MKSLFSFVFSVFTILSSVGYSAPLKTIELSSAVDLAIDAPSVQFQVNYPGLGAKAVCSLGLQMKPHLFITIDQLRGLLNVKERFSNQVLPIVETDSKTGEIALELNLYVTVVSISTRDGRTLREVLADEGIYQNSLIVVGNPCPASN